VLRLLLGRCNRIYLELGDFLVKNKLLRKTWWLWLLRRATRLVRNRSRVDWRSARLWNVSCIAAVPMLLLEVRLVLRHTMMLLKLLGHHASKRGLLRRHVKWLAGALTDTSIVICAFLSSKVLIETLKLSNLGLMKRLLLLLLMLIEIGWGMRHQVLIRKHHRRRCPNITKKTWWRRSSNRCTLILRQLLLDLFSNMPYLTIDLTRKMRFVFHLIE
jgi:hypothetical protein